MSVPTTLLFVGNVHPKTQEPHGKGSLVDQDHKIHFVGTWVRGTIKGPGIFNLQGDNGIWRYSGHFEDYHLEGEATTNYTPNDPFTQEDYIQRYTGHFRRGKRCGAGVAHYRSGLSVRQLYHTGQLVRLKCRPQKTPSSRELRSSRLTNKMDVDDCPVQDMVDVLNGWREVLIQMNNRPISNKIGGPAKHTKIINNKSGITEYSVLDVLYWLSELVGITAADLNKSKIMAAVAGWAKNKHNIAAAEIGMDILEKWRLIK